MSNSYKIGKAGKHTAYRPDPIYLLLLDEYMLSIFSVILHKLINK